MRASCEATSSFGELRGSNAQHGSPLTSSISAEGRRPVEETVHEPLHDERSWSRCRQTQSAPLRRARDVMFTVESTMGSTSRDLRGAIRPMCFDLQGTSYAKYLVPLQSLPGGVQGKALRIHSARDIMQSLQDELVTIIHDENSEGVQLDVVALLLGRIHIGGCATCHEQHSVELKLTFHAEMLHSETVFPIVRPRFVDRCVLLGRHLFRFPLPERFLRISHFLLRRFLHVQLDGVADELDDPNPPRTRTGSASSNK